MTTYTIKANGTRMGEYQGETPEAAIEAYAKDAGYESYEALCEVTGDDPEDDSILDVTEFATSRHIMVTVRNESLDADDDQPHGDGIKDQGDHQVADRDALDALAERLFEETEREVEAGEYGAGRFRVMVIDYTDDPSEGADLYDEVIDAPDEDRDAA